VSRLVAAWLSLTPAFCGRWALGAGTKDRKTAEEAKIAKPTAHLHHLPRMDAVFPSCHSRREGQSMPAARCPSHVARTLRNTDLTTTCHVLYVPGTALR
jgi:hypothetical protein